MNRYSVLALVMIVIMVLMIGFAPEDKDTEMTGYADDIHQGSSGYTFWIHIPDGDPVRAFSRTEIDTSLHTFIGDYSSDGQMFFVDRISDAQSVEE